MGRRGGRSEAEKNKTGLLNIGKMLLKQEPESVSGAESLHLLWIHTWRDYETKIGRDLSENEIQIVSKIHFALQRKRLDCLH